MVKKLESKGDIKSKTSVVTKGDGQAFERIIRVKEKYARSSGEGLLEVVRDENGAVVKVVRKG